MSQEDADALKQALTQAFDRPEDFFALMDEDIVWDPGAEFPSGRVYGRNAVREFFRQWVGAFEDLRFEVLECIDAGNAVVVHQRQWGRGKGSGAAASRDFWQVWLFFEGKIVRFAQKADRREALEAAGLSE